MRRLICRMLNVTADGVGTYSLCSMGVEGIGEGFTLPEIDGVVFDIGGVLSLPDLTLRLPEMVDADGLAADPQAYADAHYVGVRAMFEHHGDRPFDIESQANWRPYDAAYASAVGDGSDVCVEAVSSLFRAGGLWTSPNVDALEAIERMYDAGVRMAVVSNNNGSALQQLAALGYPTTADGCPWFETVIDSEIVGVSKPDPAIFLLASEQMGLDPERLVYLGDTATVDVPGARRAGMVPVQLDPLRLHSDLGHLRCDSVSLLADHVLAS